MSSPITNVLSSKILAISGAVLFLCSLLSVFSGLNPFWFRLRMQLTFVDDFQPESQQVSVMRDINCGIFFLDENRFVNILMLDKADNTHFMPALLHVAQIFYLLGSIGIVICCATAVLLALKRYGSPTAELCLAAGTSSLAICQVLSIVLILVHFLFYPDAVWQNFPVQDYIPNRYSYYTVLNAVPTMFLEWGFYIGCVSAFFSLAGAVGMWFHACCSCCHLQKVRYQLLREKPDLGSSPIPSKPSYPAYPNPGFVRTSPTEYPAVAPMAVPVSPGAIGMELDL